MLISFPHPGSPVTIAEMTRLILLVLLNTLLSGCTHLFFHPQAEHVLSPNQLGLIYEDVYLTPDNATRLHGWLLPAQGEPRGTVLFLHGNAENISTHIGSVHWLPVAGYNVFLFDYRGYGKSQGQPDVAGSLADIETALRFVTHDERLKTNGVVVFGQSLGGALAIEASAHSNHRALIRAVITESAFSDFRAIAREKLAAFWLTWPLQYPLSWLVTAEYSPLSSISLLKPTPVLIIHGERDPVVPPHHGERLYAAAHEPRQLWLIPEGLHIDAMSRADFRARFKDYLDDIYGVRQAVIETNQNNHPN